MTKIQWTDDTANPIRVLKEDNTLGGHWCSKASEGCLNCYAEEINQNSYFGFASKLKYSGSPPPLALDRGVLRKWRGAKRKKKVFVCSMTDLFGDWVNREWQFEIFDAAAESKLIFQFLTKHPENMVKITKEWCDRRSLKNLPDNFWCGTTVENQARADERIPYLVEVPASVLFLSCEPLLEDVNLGLLGAIANSNPYELVGDRINWIIVGGESGPNARRCDEEWLRNIIDQAREAKIARFLKQYGSHPTRYGNPIKLKNKKGSDTSEWADDLRVRQFPIVMYENLMQEILC